MISPRYFALRALLTTQPPRRSRSCLVWLLQVNVECRLSLACGWIRMANEVAGTIAETQFLKFGLEPCCLRVTFLTDTPFPSRYLAGVNLENIRLARLNGN